MRGKVTGYFKMIWNNRITPAYAGKSMILYVWHYLQGDHPRLCGEKIVSHKDDITAFGSPPPMRGKAQTARLLYDNEGITPAYAGKRTLLFTPNLDKWDHPRLCGEKVLVSTPKVPTTGSPPPMRGKGIDR